MTEETQAEVVEQTEAAPVTQVEEPASPVEDSPKPTDESKPKDEDRPEKMLTQKEVDEVIAKRLSRESRKLERQIRAEIENKYLREQLATQSKPEPTQPSGEPKPENFKDYESYIEALTDYKVDQKLAGVQARSAQQQQAQVQQSAEQRIRDNLSKAAEKYDDFEDVVSNPSLPITLAMRDAIGESDVGGEIAYYLGSNLKEAAEIAQLSPVQQVKAIDRLEQKLKTPPKVSEAPAPAQVVGKGKATQQIDLATASLDDYMKMRQKQGARWANR